MKTKIFSRTVCIALSILLTTACVGLQPNHLDPSMKTNPPKVVAVLPPENITANTEVEEKLYPIISTRLAERGYYVLSPELIRNIFLANKLEDAGTINALPPQRFRDTFGADAVLITRVTDWSSKFFVVGSSVSVGLDMSLIDTRSGTLLWQLDRTLARTPQTDSGGGLVGAIINSAIHASIVPYEPIADENTMTIYSTIPNGPYFNEWGTK